MNVVYASTYVYRQFLSSVTSNFLNAGLLHSWYLFLGILFFDAIVNGIGLLVSLSDCSLLVYKNATDFWIFILYPATLLNSFINSSRFLVESLGLSVYTILSSATAFKSS